MIRKLTEQDRFSVLEYLYKEEDYNIFIIGDIEQFGFDEPFQHIYGEMEGASYLSVLLIYRENIVYYSDQTMFNTDYLSIINQYQYDYVNGKTELIHLLFPHLSGFLQQDMYFLHANTLKPLVDGSQYRIKEITTEEECGLLYDLLCEIDEFSISNQNRSSYIDNRMTSLNMGYTFYIEENGNMVSTVTTTAETSKNAMVVAVATHPKARNKGYATALMQHLMQFYFEEKHKSLCLFYDNPNAGAIYKRLGFKDLGHWSMCKRER